MDPETFEANADFFDHAENFDRMLEELHKAALTDNLGETVEKLPEQFSIVSKTWSVYSVANGIFGFFYEE